MRTPTIMGCALEEQFKIGFGYASTNAAHTNCGVEIKAVTKITNTADLILLYMLPPSL